MAQAKKPTPRTVKEGERQKDLKFRDAVVAQGKVLVPASIAVLWWPSEALSRVQHHSCCSSASFCLRRFSVTLHNALANSFFKHLGRANARAFRDESRDAGVIIDAVILRTCFCF
jgi:hypothetical protein